MTGVRNRAPRSRPGSASQDVRNDVGGGGAQNGSPTAGPASTSSMAAASRTVRAIGPVVARPTGSPYMGAPLIRPRVGLRPKRPQQLAGIRIDPPPSDPCATGTRLAVITVGRPP